MILRIIECNDDRYVIEEKRRNSYLNLILVKQFFLKKEKKYYNGHTDHQMYSVATLYAVYLTCTKRHVFKCDLKFYLSR